ncbi:carbohydrate kinase [Micromonospora sp. CPCC 206060]|uniref:carbohydrate kinase family protein n=1 Tax=Micromonospora sp. CPCC 206060 TaxID=3122406 RepID=UPI002FEF818D
MITVVGETVVDMIRQPTGRLVSHPGGSPANVAVALSRLGHPTALVTQLGDDPPGRMLLAHLRANGVHVTPGSVRPQGTTSVAHTRLDPDGQASYDFNITWDTIVDAALDPSSISGCLHTGSLAAVLEPGAGDVLALLQRARSTSMISFDPNCRPSVTTDVATTRQRIEMLVATSDIVKVSVEDLAWLYPRRRYDAIAESWLRLGAVLVVVTLGDRGAWASTHHHRLLVDAHPVEVVDTIGAGDAFTAGMLAAVAEKGLLTGSRRPDLAAADRATLNEVVGHACQVAARTCARQGADPPTRAELSQAATGC